MGPTDHPHDLTVDQPAIGDHAHIGDGRAHALVDPTGSISWMAMPENPCFVVFDALLDPERGGRFGVEPLDPYRVTRRYLTESMVLETTYTTDRGSLVVTDCFTLHVGAMLPWVELARRLHCRHGVVDVGWTVEPNLVIGRCPSGFRSRRGHLIADTDGLRLGLQHWGVGTPELTERGAVGRATMVAGEDALLTAVAVADEPLPGPDRHEIENRVDRTIQAWRRWTDGVAYDGRWADQVRQSARVLKLLTHEPDGAIMAAPTTSLPERLGGDRNYDYRYCWIRDASFTIDALLRVALVEEAHHAITALLGMAARTTPHLAPFYEIDGSVPDDAEEIDLPGYRRSRPVWNGNRAARQLQLGNWGDLFESVWLYVRRDNDLDGPTADLLTELADRICEIWRLHDSGIWELPEERHYTISKIGAWTALDRAEWLAGVGQIDGDTQRWSAERARIRAFVEDRCWSPEKGSFTFHAATDDLDAATLLASRFGFVEGNSDRMTGTIAAITDELTDGPFVWRYSGQQQVEGAFVPCSFWLADALTRAGRLDDAADQMDGTLRAMTPLGLLSEEYDPRIDTALGNFPQALSHLSLVNAACSYAEAAQARDDARPGPGGE